MPQPLILGVHVLQLVTHLWFMKESVLNFTATKTYDIVVWDQVRYLTNFSNWLMLLFLVPLVYYDIRSQSSPKAKGSKYQHRYPYWVHLNIQAMNAIIILVMVAYTGMVYLSRDLLLKNMEFTTWQHTLLFYLHGGNVVLILPEFLLYDHPVVRARDISVFFVVFILTYLGIYGLFFYIYNRHVYPFQEHFTVIQTILFYSFLFVLLFIIEQTFKKLLQNPYFTMLIYENWEAGLGKKSQPKLRGSHQRGRNIKRRSESDSAKKQRQKNRKD